MLRSPLQLHLSRRGTAYVAAVGLGMMVAAIALGGLAHARVRAATIKLQREEIHARAIARSAIEVARNLIRADTNWRTNRTNGLWESGLPIGEEGWFDIYIENPSGALNRSALDSVLVTGDAYYGSARQRILMQLDAKTIALNCLSVPLAVKGAITATTSTINPAGATITSNSGVTSVLANIRPNVEAGTTIIGTGFSGTTTTGAGARVFPASNAFDAYIAAGTTISVSSLPTVSSKPTIQKIVLGPSSNPYGVPNPNGIYVIDCQNQSVVIQNSRIVGTLVLLNAGASTAVSGSVRWVPATSGYPCLLVNGPLSLQMSNSNLNEGSQSTNFNPPGTPYIYPTGTTDTDTNDSYPSSISGLVYASGNVSTSNAPSVSMLMVGGSLSVGGTLTLAYDAAFATSPPPGFYTVSMTPSQGSWRVLIDDLPESVGGASK